MRRRRKVVISSAAILAVVVGSLAWLGGERLARADRAKAVRTVALGAGGEIWVGTESSLLKYGPGGVQTKTGFPAGVHHLLVDPGKPSQMYALAESGHLYQSQDSGHTWKQTRGHGLPDAPIRTVAYDPSGPTRLVALVAGHGYFQSDLSGDMWMQLGTQDLEDATSMVVNPLDPRTVLVGTARGLFMSTNQGARFEPAGSRYDWNLKGSIYSLAVAGNRSAIVAATERDLLRSVDGGRSWSPLGETGLPDVAAVAINPGRSQFLLAGSKSGALAVSHDGGQKWDPVR